MAKEILTSIHLFHFLDLGWQTGPGGGVEGKSHPSPVLEVKFHWNTGTPIYCTLLPMAAFPLQQQR